MADVLRPDYYNRGGIEVWDIFLAYDLSAPKAFAVKYILRAGEKDKEREIEDINKAIKCLERAKLEVAQRIEHEVEMEKAAERVMSSLIKPRAGQEWCMATNTQCTHCEPAVCDSRVVVK